SLQWLASLSSRMHASCEAPVLRPVKCFLTCLNSRVIGPTPGDLQSQPHRSGGAVLLSSDAVGTDAPCRWLTLVHDTLLQGQHDCELSGAPFRFRASHCDVTRPGATTGNEDRRIPRRGAWQDHARGALRRDDRLRGTPALTVLWNCRRQAVFPRLARQSRWGSGATAIVRSGCWLV